MPADNEHARNPTLSYTARLEARIRQLEAELASVRGQNSSTGDDGDDDDSATITHQGRPETTSPPHATSSMSLSPTTVTTGDGDQGKQGVEAESSGSVSGIKVDGSGGITYHGITSFFHLPSESRESPSSSATASSLQSIQRRERLNANAWQQRLLENYSEIPASSLLFNVACVLI